MNSPIKALIFDLDGTAIPNSPHGIPSQRVIDAVQKAKELIKVSGATGREWDIAQPIFEKLQLTSLSIISGGTQIIDSISGEIVWQKLLSATSLKEIVRLCSDFPYAMGALSDPRTDLLIKDYEYFFDKPIVYIAGVPKEEAVTIVTLLKSIKNINVLPVTAWTKGDVDIHITHVEANKKHALSELLQLENISPESIMVVGDSNNDLPLFEVGGWKVAMGNGTEELKSKADWVAPSVDEDGLAIAIEKFILK